MFEAESTRLFDLNRNAEALFGLLELALSDDDFAAPAGRGMARDPMVLLARLHRSLYLMARRSCSSGRCARPGRGAPARAAHRAHARGSARYAALHADPHQRARQRDERIAAAERAVPAVQANAALTESLHETAAAETTAPWRHGCGSAYRKLVAVRSADRAAHAGDRSRCSIAR
ncbi:MAG: hypothetical protein R3E65_08365 [Steroidobacteraceae bacterium]